MPWLCSADRAGKKLQLGSWIIQTSLSCRAGPQGCTGVVGWDARRDGWWLNPKSGWELSYACSSPWCEGTGGFLTCLAAAFLIPFTVMVIAESRKRGRSDPALGRHLLVPSSAFPPVLRWAANPCRENTEAQKATQKEKTSPLTPCLPKQKHCAAAEPVSSPTARRRDTLLHSPRCGQTRLSLHTLELVILSQMCLSKNTSLVCFLTICPGSWKFFRRKKSWKKTPLNP